MPLALDSRCPQVVPPQMDMDLCHWECRPRHRLALALPLVVLAFPLLALSLALLALSLPLALAALPLAALPLALALPLLALSLALPLLALSLPLVDVALLALPSGAVLASARESRWRWRLKRGAATSAYWSD